MRAHMPCAYLVDDPRCRCAAVSGTIIPTLHERERYCRGDHQDRCPTLRAYRVAGAPISEETYYAIWIPPRGIAVNSLHVTPAAM
jgi:hypothetical protein